MGEIIRLLPVTHDEYGYVTVRKSSLLQLPSPLLRRVLSALIQHTSGDIKSVPYRSLAKISSALPDLRTTTIRRCYIFQVDENTIGFSTIPEPTPVPIKVGEQLHWIGKWEVTLSAVSSQVPHKEQYYVRPFQKDDHQLLRRQPRKLKSRLPLLVRYALPVLTDDKGSVIAIPHFNYRNKNYKVKISVKYKPLVSLHHNYGQ